MTNYENNKYKSNVFNIALMGILIALCLIFKGIFNFFPIVNGYGLSVYISIYILGIICIQTHKYKWTFVLLTPWVLLLIPSGAVNFWDLLMEYVLPLYVFFPIVYFPGIITLLTKKVNGNKNKLIIELVSLTILILILFTIKLVIHIAAGAIWYTNGNWYASLVINIEIIYIDFAVCTPIVLLCYPSLKKLINNFYGIEKRQEDSDTCIQV